MVGSDRSGYTIPTTQLVSNGTWMGGIRMSVLTETMPGVWFLEYDALGDPTLPAEAVSVSASAASQPSEASPQAQER